MIQILYERRSDGSNPYRTNVGDNVVAMEVILIIVTAGAGILDVLLEEVSINLALLIRF